MVRLDIVSWRDGAKIIGAIGQKYIDVNILAFGRLDRLYASSCAARGS